MKMIMETLLVRVWIGMLATISLIGGVRPPEATGANTFSLYVMEECHNKTAEADGWTPVKVRELVVGPIAWHWEKHKRKEGWRFDGKDTLQRVGEDGTVSEERYVFWGTIDYE